MVYKVDLTLLSCVGRRVLVCALSQVLRALYVRQPCRLLILKLPMDVSLVNIVKMLI